jgi:LysM domain
VGITGAGATSPHAGAGRGQTIPDPPWVIFGHEVCGHARLQAGGMGPTQAGHAGTPEGDVTTVDIENRIRREHSTVADSLGIRGGTFSALDAAGNFVHHSGSVYRVSAGETVTGIAWRCGLSVVDMLDHMWRSNGDRITLATRNTLAVGERLLVEGIDWHEVIKGETMTSIAAMWAIPLASLQRANPDIKGPAYWIRPGYRLLIPAA